MPSALGDYLRSRRDAVRPAQVGLLEVGVRRVPGLRREELAMLAGVSVDYYVRLEQGRERPSPQVLDALAATLRLDHDARAHLFHLAGVGPKPAPAPGPERVEPALLHMLAAWPHHPAVVLGRAYDVLAANDLADELFGGYPTSRNLVVNLFLDDHARELYVDWERDASNAVAGLRLQDGACPGHPRIQEVVTMLLERSPAFARRWAANDVAGKTLLVKHLRHPRVGDLTLRMLSFDVRSSPGQQLVVYQADPGTRSAEAITLLGTLAATRRALPT